MLKKRAEYAHMRRGEEFKESGDNYVHIYKGVCYKLPKQPRLSDIDGYELSTKDQYWRIPTPPASLFEEIDYDADGNPVFSSSQVEFINSELDRWENGYWFMNNGKATYITGDHYFFLTSYTLETGEKADFWHDSKLYFYFHDTARADSMCDGVIRAKRRRRGATTEATASQMKTALTVEKAFCGFTSKTNKDAKDAFINMTKNAFMSLPAWAKPRVYDEDSQTELWFRKEKERAGSKKKKGMTKGGLNKEKLGIESRLDYRPTAMNSYDSGRQTYSIADEGGKYPPEIPFNEYWAILQQTIRIGGRRVGFANLPSTCNKLTKGGRGFKILWDDSDMSKYDKTGSGLWQYFEPAFLCYEPYIDRHGFSITEKPTKDQIKWMKERYGASDLQCSMSAEEWLDFEEGNKKDDASRKEFRRMYPRTEKDAFDYEAGDNIYDRELIGRQKEFLAERDLKYRTVKFFMKSDGTVDFVDVENGPWKILFLPRDGEANRFIDGKGGRKPGNAAVYGITADPFKSTQTSGGKVSMGAGGIWRKFDQADPENSGLLCAVYWNRPKLRRHFHEQMLLAAIYYGAELFYESDYDDYIEYLMELDLLGYAKERPKSTIDPNRKKRIKKGKEFGVKSADGFSYATMIERSIAYLLESWSKIYFMEVLDQLDDYDENARTDFDLAVMFQLGAVLLADPVKPKVAEKKKSKQLINTYRIKL